MKEGPAGIIPHFLLKRKKKAAPLAQEADR
jgi:hypothetical protein